jgi:salicylate hydroxylase
VLAACLRAAGAADDPAETLRRYEGLRLPRVSRLQAMSRANKLRFHLPDGPDQAARDAAWATEADRSPAVLQWLYGYDAGAIDPADGP